MGVCGSRDRRRPSQGSRPAPAKRAEKAKEKSSSRRFPRRRPPQGKCLCGFLATTEAAPALAAAEAAPCRVQRPAGNPSLVSPVCSPMSESPSHWSGFETAYTESDCGLQDVTGASSEGLWSPQGSPQVERGAELPVAGSILPPVPQQTCAPTRCLIRDGLSGRVAEANGQGLPIETELFSGRFCIFTRTGPSDSFFAGKKRRVEIQIQGRWKKAPSGTVFMGGEVPEVMKLGMGTRAACGMLITFARAFNSTLHVHLTGAPGTDERPHMALPLPLLIDSWHETMPGEEPPRLGSRLPQGDLKQLRKQYHNDFPFRTDSVCTMSWHSMYFDFETWQIANVPGANGSSLRNFWGQMPFTLAAYALPPGAKNHGPSQRTPIFEVSMYHESHADYAALAQGLPRAP
eukprot:TRINITY_DN15241_c0_g1_i1.p1 TRINITY_DN15241_c0_g1~~TRINITY_DN15241_c0_g1_i1.p1  ORF type:complete len:431 (+),score=135.51 TRINITY_DN15241_c0_g1_i1:85-1293(+)